MQYFNTILKQKAIIFRRVKFVFRHGSKVVDQAQKVRNILICNVLYG